MTYPPGTSGYPPAQQPPGSYGSSTASFAKTEDAESKLPVYLSIAVVALGLAAYLATFGPMQVMNSTDTTINGAGTAVTVAVVAALLAGVGLLPKAKNYTPIVAVTAVTGALLTISEALTPGESFSVGWGLWLALGFTVLQAVAAVGALLLEAGVVTAPAPKPKYDQYAQYGLPQGGGYYGQPGGQQAPGQQQSGYPSYGSYPSGPSTGGFSAQGPSTGGFATGAQPTQQVQQQQGQQHQGPPTPPTGFPSFGQPPSVGQGGPNSGHGQQQQHGQQHGQQQPGQGQQAPSGPQQQ